MSITQAANRGYKVYTLALKRKVEDTEAYIRGLDFIIDKVYHDAELTSVTMRAVQAYERKVGA